MYVCDSLQRKTPNTHLKRICIYIHLINFNALAKGSIKLSNCRNLLNGDVLNQ